MEFKTKQKNVVDYLKSVGYTPKSNKKIGIIHTDFGPFTISIALSQKVTYGMYSEFYLYKIPKNEEILEEIGKPLNHDIIRFESYEETCKEIDRLIAIVNRYKIK